MRQAALRDTHRHARLSSTLALAATVGAAIVLLLSCTDDVAHGQVAHAQAPPAGTISYVSVASPALRGRLSFAVYTPPGYAVSAERYPVVYFLHGLPAGPDAYRSRIAFVARHFEEIGAEAIAVVPQGARPGDVDPEYYDWGPGRNWQTAISAELPRYVDAHYRTIAGRGGRAIVGISAGGYGAVIIGLHHPEEYSVIEAWSGYFVARNLRGDAALDLGSDSRNVTGSAYAVVSALHGVFARLPTYLAFYVGRSDPLFYTPNRTYDEVLRLLGVPHTFAVYPGTHNDVLFNAHADAWLRSALDHLAPAA
jgi:S-formylglutathione hydrolase FrmB